jgi:hypothetical protein
MKSIDDGVPRGHAGHHHTQDEMHNIDVAHEHADIDISGIVSAAAGLAAVTAVAFVLMAGLFRLLDSQARKNDPVVSPLAAQPTNMPRHIAGPEPFGSAPGPRLLTNEPAVLREQRSTEESHLSGYGWVNEQAGVARMPIAEAKKLLAERGLPARADAVNDPSLGTVRPSTAESSSGRTADGLPRGAGLPPIQGAPAQQTPLPGQAKPGHAPAKPGGHER